jgi:NAD(P)-dependent dehydrogenase (short-subunit alcohol dehydrogenase family)
MAPATLFDLSGRVAIVTGGSRGIGQAIAEAFAAAGAQVAIIARQDMHAAELVATSIRDGGGTAISLQADVADGDQVTAMVRAVEQQLGSVNVLVNNAGTSFREAADRFPRESWDRVLAVNLTGPFLCAQAVFPAMQRAGGGSIINVTSMAGLVAIPGTVAYSASKGGLVQLTRALAIEWAAHGIRVNGLAPCPVETELSRRIFADKPEVLADLVKRIPLGRIAQPPDLAGAALYLASDASQMVTGTILEVDGGWTAQ